MIVIKMGYVVLVGGNHEAINHLRELYYGGWVAPNIYFLGYSGVVHFGGLRIAGISGIYNQRHYNMGYHERLPYNEGTKRSTYHTRVFDVFKLKQASLASSIPMATSGCRLRKMWTFY